MKHWVTGIALVGMTTGAWADKQVDDMLETTDSPSVDIRVEAGEVTVRVWDENAVKLEGVIDDDNERFEFRARSRDSVQIVIERDHPSGYYRNNDDDTDITVTVPRGSALAFDTVNASFDVEGLRGVVSADSVNGSLDLRNIEGRVAVESVNGRVTLEAVAGDVDVETVNSGVSIDQVAGDRLDLESVNGRVKITTTATRIDIETVNGDLALDAGDVSRIDMSAVSGTIEAALHLVHQGELAAETVSGDLELLLRKPHDLRVDIETLSGDIDNRVSDDAVTREEYGPGRYLDFALGNGSARVQAVTLSGGITLKAD